MGGTAAEVAALAPAVLTTAGVGIASPELPADVAVGDVLAVAGTSAYHHGRGAVTGRPPVVAVDGGRRQVLVTRRTFVDLLAAGQPIRREGWGRPVRAAPPSFTGRG